MASTEVHKKSDDDATMKTTSRWRRPAVIVAVVLGVAVVFVLPVVSTLQPGYYERYDGLQVRMDQWRQSTHARVGCAGCHIEPGLVGAFTFAARSIPAFYSQVVFGPSETNLLGAPGAKACERCHTGFRQVSPDGDLMIPHRAHVEILKMNCTTCHEGLVHAPNPEGINRPSMEGCLERCHDGDQASAECTDCHTRKQTPESHASADWLKTHSDAAKKGGCGECHAWSPDFCGECHRKRPATHAGNWKTTHAVRARADSEGCRVCHDQKFCKECH